MPTPQSPVPQPPPDSPRPRGRVHLRFEDVTQAGRPAPESLPRGLGPTVWKGILQSAPLIEACRRNGVFPILTRLVLEGTPGPFSANGPVEAEGTARVARSDDGRIV